MQRAYSGNVNKSALALSACQRLPDTHLLLDPQIMPTHEREWKNCWMKNTIGKYRCNSVADWYWRSHKWGLSGKSVCTSWRNPTISSIVYLCKIAKPSKIKDQKSDLHSIWTVQNIKTSLSVLKVKNFFKNWKVVCRLKLPWRVGRLQNLLHQ